MDLDLLHQLRVRRLCQCVGNQEAALRRWDDVECAARNGAPGRAAVPTLASLLYTSTRRCLKAGTAPCTSTGGDGGAVGIVSQGIVKFQNCAFYDNYCQWGSGGAGERASASACCLERAGMRAAGQAHSCLPGDAALWARGLPVLPVHTL